MIIEWWNTAKLKNKALGREAKTFNDRNSLKFLGTFMGRKDKIGEEFKTMEDRFAALREIMAKYVESADSKMENQFVSNINDNNDKISGSLKKCNKLLAEMKTQMKEKKYNKATKDDPDTRVMVGVTNAIQTKIYKYLQISQKLQVEVKEQIKIKLRRQLKNATSNMDESDIDSLVENPIQAQELIQKNLFKQTHQVVRNAVQDMNWRYQELGKLERNMKALFGMMQDLSMIVKNQTEILNSIEENLKGTNHYLLKAEKNLTEAKQEYLTAKERLCCISVLLMIVALICLWPILSIVT